MCWQIVSRMTLAIGMIGQSSCTCIVLPTDARQTAAGCEVETSVTSLDEGNSQVPLSENHANVMQRLERVSELDLVGHPSPLIGLLWLIEDEEGGEDAGWNIPVKVDRHALIRNGIRLEELSSRGRSTGGLRAGGVSRRSSLRFVLSANGLAYYVDDAHLVVTTKEIARAKWLEKLPKPKLETLVNGSITERRDAAFALGFWHVDPDDWAEPLASALTNTDRDVSFDVAYALGEMGPQAEKAIDALLKCLKSEDLTLREAAVFAVGKIGPKATTGLLALIDDRDSEVAIAAAKSLGVMGSVGKEAIPRLIEAAKRHNNNEELCARIATSIAAIDLGDAIPKLCQLLKSKQTGIRAFAADTIAEIGPPAQSCASGLLPLLTDPAIRSRIAAAHALSRIDLPEDFPTDALEAAAKDEDRHVSLWAQEALQVIKSKRKVE